jgi:hypothetical protein
VNPIVSTYIPRPVILQGVLFFYASKIFGLYCGASARCEGWINSLPAKSAIVCASFSTR